MYTKLTVISLALAPVLVLANEACNNASLKAVLGRFLNAVISPIITLLFAAALLFFFWGLFRLIMALSAGESGSEGKQHMLWGLVGMVIMFSAIGIVNLVSNSVEATQAACIGLDGGFQ